MAPTGAVQNARLQPQPQPPRDSSVITPKNGERGDRLLLGSYRVPSLGMDGQIASGG